MPGEEVELSQLTEEQQLALQQFTSVTDQEIGAAVPLLRKCEWNVQIAIARFFDGEPPEPIVPETPNIPPPATTRRGDTLINGFSDLQRPQRHGGLESAPRITSQPISQLERPTPAFLSLVVTPFNLVYNLLSRILSILSYIFPFLPRLLARLAIRSRISNSQRNASGRRPLGPQDTTARFLREFEEEYGAHALPFLETGYARAFDLAKNDLKFLLVVPVSPEHDDTSAFIRTVLLSETVVNYLNDPANNILLWAGSIQDSEAFQVASALSITTFPCAALIAHTPSVSSTAMSVVARVGGPTNPTSFLAGMQAAIRAHSEALNRARAARSEQQAARTLREQQNSAYERSLAQDRERAQKRREAEAEKAQLEQQRREAEAKKQRKLENQAQWRRWRAKAILPEPGPDVKDAVRLSLRLLDGERVIRRFAPTAPLEEVYAFVDCYEILQQGAGAGAAEQPSDTKKPAAYEHEYDFRLVSPIPREEYEVSAGGTVRDRIGRSGNLIVELIDAEEE